MTAPPPERPRPPVADRLAAAAAVVRGASDVIAGRVLGPEVPVWCARRGWDRWLLGLDDEALLRFEEGALPRAGDDAPTDLIALSDAVRAATDWLLPTTGDGPAAHVPGRAAGVAHQRKDRQVEALVARLGALDWRPRRVVDVGSGLGRLTRALARALDVPALGLERDAGRVGRARERAARDPGRVRFEPVEVGAAVRGLGADDLVVGLHACGALGDGIVAAAREAGAGVVLVGCCLQAIDASERPPLSVAGRRHGLALPRDVLGLTNLHGRAHGVGGSAPVIAERRVTRLALRLLLADRGVVLEAGAESRGLSRRQLDRGIAHVAGLALERRGLPPAAHAELAPLVEQARVAQARVRRLSVPRLLLGRVLELAVVLDRACALAEAGRAVTVEPLFPREVSPRNLGLVSAGG